VAHGFAGCAAAQVHLVVMANLFNRMQLHQRFDIKGSRLGRSAGPEAKQQVCHTDSAATAF